MDWQIIQRIVLNLENLNYAGRVSWFWINEPLADSRLVEIIRFTRDRLPNVFLSLVTNGDLLTIERFANLKSAGLDALGVSVYDNAMLAKVSALRDEKIAILDMREACPGQLENRGGNIQVHKEAFKQLTLEVAGKSCARPFKMLTINVRGQVVLCCADMYSDVVIGDVNHERLETIWNNSLFNSYRDTLLREGRGNLKLCQGCSFAGSAPAPFFPLLRVPDGVSLGCERSAEADIVGQEQEVTSDV